MGKITGWSKAFFKPRGAIEAWDRRDPFVLSTLYIIPIKGTKKYALMARQKSTAIGKKKEVFVTISQVPMTKTSAYELAVKRMKTNNLKKDVSQRTL